MKHPIAFLFALLISGSVTATPQLQEVLRTPEGDKSMLADPLSQVRIHDPELWSKLSAYIPKETCSALWRGYVGTWEIIDSRLYLLSLQTSDCRASKVVPLENLFSETGGPVAANWYSGELLLEGGPRTAGPCGFAPTCPTEYEVFTIQQDQLVRIERRKPSNK